MSLYRMWRRRLFSIIFFRLPKHIKTPFLISFLLSFVLALSFLLLYFSLQPVVPLFYSLPQPNDYLAPKELLVIFPLLALTITFSHLFLLRYINQYEKTIQAMFAWATLVIEVLLTIAFFRIILIVS